MHDVHRALALLGEGVEVGLSARTWSLSPEEVRAALVEVHRLENQLTALRLMLVRASVLQDNGDSAARRWPPGRSPASTWTSPAAPSRGSRPT